MGRCSFPQDGQILRQLSSDIVFSADLEQERIRMGG